GGSPPPPPGRPGRSRSPPGGWGGRCTSPGAPVAGPGPCTAGRRGQRGRSRIGSGVEVGAVLALQLVELGAKFADVLEAAVHRGKTYVGHLVELPQGLHHPLPRSEERTSELQSRENPVCRLLLQ